MDVNQLETLAQEYFDLEKYLDAKPLYEELVRRVPNWEHGRGSYELGLCYEKLGMFPEALEQFQHTNKIQPYNSFFLYKLAKAELTYGDLNSALARHIDLYILLQVEAPGPFANEVSRTIEELALQLNETREMIDLALHRSRANSAGFLNYYNKDGTIADQEP